jgi:hypothetical protein
MRICRAEVKPKKNARYLIVAATLLFGTSLEGSFWGVQIMQKRNAVIRDDCKV